MAPEIARTSESSDSSPGGGRGYADNEKATSKHEEDVTHDLISSLPDPDAGLSEEERKANVGSNPP